MRDYLKDLDLTSAQLAAVEAHYRSLVAWSPRTNLTAIKDPKEIARTLYAESILLARTIPEETQRVIDVGSGAGFPGVLVAICRPRTAVILVEADLKKSIFLQESTSHLPNIRVLRNRFEQVTGTWDYLTSRAVAWSQISKHANTLADRVTLLTSRNQLPSLLADERWVWAEPTPIPWNGDHVVIEARRITNPVR
ncbi:MAG: RsmG family class I SAM-dependent methyltransferase [Bryobacteraceae bacterium]